MNTRALAATTLGPVIAGKASLSKTFAQNIAQLENAERAFFLELCYGTLRRYHRLSSLVKKLMDKPLKGKDQDIQALLLLGVYQLSDLRVPDHAAISETVNAAKALKKHWATRLVNGVLRNYQRRAEELTTELQDDSEFCWSHPEWIVARLQSAWPENWERILHANNTRPPITIRVKTRKTDIASYKQLLSARSIRFQQTRLAPQGLQLENFTGGITDLPGYESGLFSVQDEGAQLAANLLTIADGSRILDACSAPGGKAAHLLERCEQIEELVCIDIDNERMQRVQENLSRLEHAATLIADDAGNLESWWDGNTFDGILLDAPCSASGVIRRHPDIKILRRAADLVKLAELQAELLRKVWQTLTPGGSLIYATCSILPEENEDVVQAFVEEQANAMHDFIAADWGVQRPFGRQLLPAEDSHDGFYYARIIKRR